VHEALAAFESLRERRICARVIDAYSVKPVDADGLRHAALETGRLLVVEDHAPEGGLGEAVSSALRGLCPVHHLAVRSTPRSGTLAELLDSQGISATGIVEAALALTAEGPPPSRRVPRPGAESEPPPAEQIASGLTLSD
jgi:transketolase